MEKAKREYVAVATFGRRSAGRLTETRSTSYKRCRAMADAYRPSTDFKIIVA